MPMISTTSLVPFVALALLSRAVTAASPSIDLSFTPNYQLLPRQDFFTTFDKRPEDCPPCFNCNLGDFVCHQFANCTPSSGKCACPSGFGGEDCSTPLCGSLADGNNRLPRQGNSCDCKEGWEGINCNVCTTNDACKPFMPKDGENDAVCYKDGLVVQENWQMCNITNRKIVDQLKDQIPQATFSCNADKKECNFQFWVDQLESFYCALDTCDWSAKSTPTSNSTSYRCEHIKCRCVPGRMLCGKDGSIDLSDYLEQQIKGPASFTSTSAEGKPVESRFKEPNMDSLIQQVFGDESISLQCRSGECLAFTQLPGYEQPVKKINTPLIAGIISGCALFVVFLGLLIFILNRRKSDYGLIRLDSEEEEENAKLLADHKPAALFFEDVSYNLKGKQILSGISGHVHPGELLAIMGASGAGKTTFLDLLARKKKRGLVDGQFWLNGEKVTDDDFRSVIGFVDQDDTMLSTLTVHETIMDSALLRLPKEMSLAAKKQKVEDVERQLGIHHIRDQIIGSEEGSGRGISGGEKRRVGIACELVTSPSILFLDEPTSGLDAFNAFNVVECLVTLVKTYNRTVVFTIHQPRSNIVALFDQLILLANGRTVYSGPFHKCQHYFDSVGYACPPGFNIADYLVDLTMHASTSTSLAMDDHASGLLSPGEDGRDTRPSSTRAVKSIASIANASIDGSASSQDHAKPKFKRKISIRKQQERQLYSRRNTLEAAHPPPASERSEGDSIMETDGRQQWVKLARQQYQPAPQEDPHDLPYNADGVQTDLDILVSAFASSNVHAEMRADLQQAIASANQSNGHPPGADIVPETARVMGYRKPGIHYQFYVLARRTWRNLYRNPMLMLTHYAIAIVLAVVLGYLFYGLTDDLKGFQNRMGLFFFLLVLFAFSTLTSVTTFSPERLLFLRERAKGYYNPFAYYIAKVVFDIVPLRVFPPLIMGCIAYPMTGLQTSWPIFFKFILFIMLFNLAAATICLFLGIAVRNSGVANLLGVLVMLFSLLYSGLLLNRETIPAPLLWIQSLSIAHYAFEGLMVNEVNALTLVDNKYGVDIRVPGSAILSLFGFYNNALWRDAIGLSIFCGAFLILGYAAMHFLLVERR